MRFLVDRCAGRRLAKWLSDEGHDVVGAWVWEPDPGDEALLALATAEDRILITIDTDFGDLVFLQGLSHKGLLRLPDVPSDRRIELTRQVLERFGDALANGAIVTVRGERIRISRYS